MPLILAIAASIVVLVSAPVIGQIRGAIQDAFPDYYRPTLVAAVLLSVGAGVAVAILRIRSDRALRYGLLAAAVGVGTAYSIATATGTANVDAVERFHFVEYGLLTLLFYRAWMGKPGASAFLLPFLAVFIVGTMDEGIQWFVPARVGEWRDVLLNSVAIACGLMFGAGLEGVRSVRLQPDRLAPITMAALAFALFAAFFYTVHVGYEIRDAEIGAFRSRYSADQLIAHAADRAARWKTPPDALRRFSREDQYLAEALWHIQRRNDMEGDGGVWATWKENLILEKYFAPVLDIPTYATPAGARWPPEQRANSAAAAAQEGERPFISDAHPFPIYAWR